MMPIEPMLCEVGNPALLDSDSSSWGGWIFEAKLDGARIIAEREGDSIRLWTRRGKDVARRFPEVVECLMQVRGSWILDGELVCYSAPPKTTTDFEVLVKRMNTNDSSLWNYYSKTHPAVYWAFDILRNDVSLLYLDLLDRKEKLWDLMSHMRDRTHVQRLNYFAAGGVPSTIFTELLESGYEGIVAKRLGSKYQAGCRSKDWLKFKASDTVDVEVIGCTDSDAGLPFGALIMVKDGKYYGKVGSGFTMKQRTFTLELLRRLRSEVSPVKLPQEVLNELQFLTAPMRAEIKIMGEMSTGSPRHPVFVRWRADQ